MRKSLWILSLITLFSLWSCLGCGGPGAALLGTSSDEAPAVDDPGSSPVPPDLNKGVAEAQDVSTWQEPLTPVFRRAAAEYDLPMDLLLTLAKVGSGFENRGDAATIEGGYGLMALRKNDLGGDSLALAAELTNQTTDELIIDPAASIYGAAAVLDAYAQDAEVDREAGIEAWLPAVVKYAGLDKEDSKFFARGVYEAIEQGFAVTNSHQETFSVVPQPMQTIDLESLVPPGMKRISLDDLEAGIDPDDIGAPSKADVLALDYSGATWDPAASCNYTATVTTKDTIIIHITEGSAAGTRSWFKNCASQVSAHYVVSEAGDVWQMVDERYKAWHVGCLNSRSIGIENEGYTASSSHPAALYNAAGLLCRNICDRRGIAKAHHTCPPGILGHLDANNCVCGGSHTDPGSGWDWTYFINQVNGTNYTNPPYLFNSNAQGWTVGHSTPTMMWTGSTTWRGAMYFDQTGDDCYVYSPTTSFTGSSVPQTINVDFYPQSGTTNQHDMQFFWRTDAENSFTASKSTPMVYYTAQNEWATVNLYINNSAWAGDHLNKLRLDFDQSNSGTRYIVNHVVLQNAAQWKFDTSGSVEGWTAGHSVTDPWQTSCCGWPGILVTDQSANDGFIYSPAITGSGYPYNYLGGRNDWLHVRVYPQSGDSAIHDMAVYWIQSNDSTWNEAKSTHVTYAGQDQWVDVNLPVGQNPNWPAAHVTQLRLDFDQSNHNTRWLVDYIAMRYDGADNSAPSTPSGLTATADSQTVVSLSWTASSDNMGVNGYNVYRDGTLIGTSIGTSYVDSACSPNTSYSYQVSAYDATGNVSSNSSAAGVTTPDGDVEPPSVPAGLTATAVSGTEIDLSWNASTDNTAVTGYNVYRGGQFIGTSTTTSYADTGRTPATTYSYTVSAYDAAGNESAQSSSASATTPDTIAPSAPGSLSATTVSTSQINLSWSAASDNVGVSGYNIYRNGSFLTSVGGTSYSNTGLAMGTTYSYVITAYDAAGNESGQSNTADNTTEIIVDNSNGGFSASANWTTSSYASDRYGADYRFRSTEAVSDQATWTFNIPTADNYQVYVWWSQGTNRSAAAPYSVNGGGSIMMNQQANGGMWNSLGTFSMAAGSNNVRLSCWAASGYVVIGDAVRIVRR